MHDGSSGCSPLRDCSGKEEALLCEGETLGGFLTEACKGHLEVEHPSLVSAGLSAKSPKLLPCGYLQTHLPTELGFWSLVGGPNPPLV